MTTPFIFWRIHRYLNTLSEPREGWSSISSWLSTEHRHQDKPLSYLESSRKTAWKNGERAILGIRKHMSCFPVLSMKAFYTDLWIIFLQWKTDCVTPLDCLTSHLYFGALSDFSLQWIVITFTIKPMMLFLDWEVWSLSSGAHFPVFPCPDHIKLLEDIWMCFALLQLYALHTLPKCPCT